MMDGKSAELALEATGLFKSFGSGSKKVEAVKGVSLAIKPGEILAFLGRNGAGKTTTISMIAGLLEPDAGDVLIDGLPLSRREVFGRFGCVLEGSRNLQMQLTCIENLEYYGALKGLPLSKGRKRGFELLEMFGLTEKANARVRELSRGMLQKVSVAVSLVHSPSLLLLDEPTNGLDVESSEHIKEMLKTFTQEEGLAVLLTTHQLDVAQELAERVAVIRDGSLIAEESTKSLLAKYSGSVVVVTLEDAVKADVAGRLSELDVSLDDSGKVLTLETGGSLYQVLDLVRPTPIAGIERPVADLTDVFLNLVQSNEGGKQ